MSAKNLLTAELDYLIISKRQDMHLLNQMTNRHRLERLRKARGNAVELALERTYHSQEVIIQ